MLQVVNLILYAGVLIAGVCYLLGIKTLISGVKTIPHGTRIITFAWLALFVGLGLWFGRQERPTTLASVDTSALFQLGSVFVALYCVTFKLLGGAGAKNLRGSILFLGLYSVIGLLLSPLSPAPLLSASKAGCLIVVVIVAIVAIDVLGPKRAGKQLLNTAYLYLGVLILLALIGGILFPETTHRENAGLFGVMLAGWPALNSNSLSFIAAIIGLVGFRRLFEPERLLVRAFYFGAFASGFCVLLLAQGRTSIVGFFAGVTFLSLTIKRLNWMRAWLIGSGILLVAILLIAGNSGEWTETIETYLRRGSNDESLKSLSGRTEAWIAGWDVFLSSPVFGHGFYAAEELGIAAHNAYLLVLINSGLVGFIFWFAYVYLGFFGAAKVLCNRVSYRTPEQRFEAECTATLMILFLRTITGSDLTTYHYSTMIFVSYLVYMASTKKNDRLDHIQRWRKGRPNSAASKKPLTNITASFLKLTKSEENCLNPRLQVIQTDRNIAVVPCVAFGRQRKQDHNCLVRDSAPPFLVSDHM